MSLEIGSTVRRVLRRALPESVRNLLRVVRQPERYAHFGPPFSFRKDGMATIHRTLFRSDPAFRAAYAASMDAGAWDGSWGPADPEWRMYIACWAAGQVAHLGGDFVECGVYRGGLSRTVMSYIGFSKMVDRTYWLLDTFEGIPVEQVDAGVQHRHRYPDSWAEVSELFKAERNVRLVRGRVPDTLAQVHADRVCFVSIDMNVAMPELAAVEFFWPRLVAGGMVVIDDYGWNGHDAQQQAFDDFAWRHDRAVLALPTGQGLLVK
jgi:O-methyltransferase